MNLKLKSFILWITLLANYQVSAEAPFKVDVAGFSGNNRNFIQTGAFLPMQQSECDLLFGDVRAMRHLPNFKKKNKSIYSDDIYEFNFGLGYRKIFNQDLILGGVAYYDIRKAQLNNTVFGQATLNIHVLSQTWQSNLNIYVPVGKNNITKSSHIFTNEARFLNNDVFFKYKDQMIQEKALKGVDFRISTIIPNIDSLRVGAVTYYFHGNTSFAGGGFEASWEYNNSVNIESSITYDKLRKANFIVGVRFTLPSSTTRQIRSIDKLLSTRVERDIDLVTSNKVSNFITEERQDNAIALNNQQLSDITDPNKVGESRELISKLLLIMENNGLIIITDAAKSDSVILNDTNKYEAKLLDKSVARKKLVASSRLNNNGTEKQVVDDSVNLNTETIEKITSLIAAEKAIQEKHGFNTIFVGSQFDSFVLSQKFRDDLVRKFSICGNNKDQSYYINLPDYGNVEVERAGTILAVNKNGKNYIVIGVDNNSANRHANTGKQPYSTWFTGVLESRDGSVSEGLKRETFEESAGMIYITEAEFNYAIKNRQFMYDPQAKTLAIIKQDTTNNFDIDALNTRLSQVKREGSISGSFKEMKEYTLVHPGELRHMASVIDINKTNNSGNITRNSHDDIYSVRTINNGSARILKEYADSFYSANGVQALTNAIGSFPSG